MPVSYTANPELELMVGTYLEDNKKPFTTNEVAKGIQKEFEPVRQALYNLRNAEQIYIITFDTKEINWIHKSYFK